MRVSLCHHEVMRGRMVTYSFVQHLLATAASPSSIHIFAPDLFSMPNSTCRIQWARRRSSAFSFLLHRCAHAAMFQEPRRSLPTPQRVAEEPPAQPTIPRMIPVHGGVRWKTSGGGRVEMFASCPSNAQIFEQVHGMVLSHVPGLFRVDRRPT